MRRSGNIVYYIAVVAALFLIALGRENIYSLALGIAMLLFVAVDYIVGAFRKHNG